MRVERAGSAERWMARDHRSPFLRGAIYGMFLAGFTLREISEEVARPLDSGRHYPSGEGGWRPGLGGPLKSFSGVPTEDIKAAGQKDCCVLMPMSVAIYVKDSKYACVNVGFSAGPSHMD